MSNTPEPTIFEKLAAGELPVWKVWEDDAYFAFLTRWPNTPGFTVVAPKKNPGDNYIDVDDDAYIGLLLAAKKVAAILRKAFGAYRIALVFEGEGVPHLHIKLIPLHGTTPEKRQYEHTPVFTETYKGYFTTELGPELSEEEMTAMQKKIQEAARQ